jgi:N-methylhydantoinase B
VAQAPLRPVGDVEVPADAPVQPLSPGVLACGQFAVAEASGAVLARAPDHWTDGCPVVVDAMAGPGPAREIRSYLDPRTGRTLHVETVAAGEPRSFAMLPAHYVDAHTETSRAAAVPITAGGEHR